MPCTDGGVPYPKSREEILNEKAPAMLCALVRSITQMSGDEAFNCYVNNTDWKEAGVTKKEFVEWWAIHEQRDFERIKREKNERNEQRAREVALAKLTPTERKVLGLKK